MSEKLLSVCLGGLRQRECHTFGEASKIVRDFIEHYDLGARLFYANTNAGMVYHKTKGLIAHVSYNGRVWRNEQYGGDEITDLTKNTI